MLSMFNERALWVSLFDSFGLISSLKGNVDKDNTITWYVAYNKE
jgi:hypothetical protein